MHFNKNVDIFSNRLPDRTDILNRLPFYVLTYKSPPGTRYGIEFQSCETTFYDLRGPISKVCGVPTAPSPAVCVDAYFAPYWSAKKLVYRLPRYLSQNIPHSVFQSTHCTPKVHSSSATRKIVIHHLHKMFYVCGISADQIPFQHVNMGGDLHVSVCLGIAFSPAMNTFICVDSYEA